MLYRLVITESQRQDNKIILHPDQEHYLRRVVRLNDGQFFIAINGRGNGWQVKLTPIGGEITNDIVENKELPMEVSLMVSLPKGSGFDDIVRCTTELGVSRLYPIMADRTLLKPKENKLVRWRKIAQEASEQCERLIVPYIAPPLPFLEAIQQMEDDSSRFIAVARNTDKHLFNCLNPLDLPSQITIATGCEGGWTTNEIQSAIAHNFQPITLGKRILRAVTAPIAIMALIASLAEK
ncbi:16S rRNA (uracil(1498)-N(3))-methyltransferase [Cyanobacterium stanieri LEGE 03274]|uniref:Ribosomal RNA small subunit methyltransferase E n=1 Tax=Cyanobacterium stanieri LEGE 03274 TaxID=1828756 RepID=A0ABR9V4J8_9CHRO|nr:16S rRNA (uracil(1498)-N(3))-methyltransferase [Cyanobacterium stanieri]MBE9222797.1 16S rRNA (uracil(1498)-N(3))-methyltransferase [Cyanobacterium stanieri LEGE 03274]